MKDSFKPVQASMPDKKVYIFKTLKQVEKDFGSIVSWMESAIKDTLLGIYYA